jgi:hypothetical protein
MFPMVFTSCNYLVWDWIGEFIIAELYPQASGQKWHINPAINQSCQNLESDSKERLYVIKIPNP